ncbi:DODA-type extradiol aromatic ring-opening family dioxygenase [Paludibacterium yongneupense]|uniref:DODA-type extradiol aromatic ring-opening family dioxygenase n=1 Tax=Paludibacterium yongneupense TaxID=400061 RepID=UPI00040202C4|nr:class III extradiol ring-cleavage dioxygenase [Paludibacterium yongneupense]
MTTATQPALFISHGSPMLPLEDSPTTRFLSGLGPSLARPDAIVVVSAHWETNEITVNGSLQPETIHDFSGFPRALYQLDYPARGDAALVGKVKELLEDGGFHPVTVAQRGLDHGMWVPLMLMYPQADVPLLAVSLPRSLSAARLVEFGRVLGTLRAQNMLIVASGSYTHNLWALAEEGSAPPAWATEFAGWVTEKLLAGDRRSLQEWKTEAPHAAVNHPSDEHFRPLFVALGAGDEFTPPRLLHDDWRMGSLSMACWRFD